MDNSVFMLINGLVWPALGIFELVIAIIAHNKYKHSSTGLLLAGAVIGLITTLSYPFINLIGYYGEAIQFFYAFLNILGIIGNLVFLVGLLNLVNHLASIKAGDHAISENF